MDRFTRSTDLVSRVKKMPTRSLEKSTRVKQVVQPCGKISHTTRLERRPSIHFKTKKEPSVFQMTWDNVIRCFLFDHLIERLIELASNLVPFKCLLSLFIYFVVLRKGFYPLPSCDRLGLNMPDASSSSPLWSQGWRHLLNNAISPRSFDYSHSLSSNA